MDEADYILPGISGFAINNSGEQVTFIDPTAECHCERCIREALKVILGKGGDNPCIES